jgi:hypothetical protein
MILLLLFMAGASALVANVSILNQTNVVERFPNLANRVRCQNITDIYLQPLLVAADDAVLPPITFFQSQRVVNGLDDCSALTFAFSGIRMKSFSNPTSITVMFMRGDGEGGGPGSLLYRKSLPWATNDQMWQKDYLALPWTYEVTLQWNEVGDDGVTRLDFRSPAFLPPLQRFWLAFYCTAPQQIGTGFRLNAMYWVTLNNLTGSTPLRPQLFGGVPNRDFLFRDVNNLLKFGFTNWTTAKAYETVAGIVPSTNNLAWSLFFTCNVSAVPTFAPVESPTLGPTAPIAPTASPTQTPTSNATNNRTEWNITARVRDLKGGEIALIVVVPLTLLLASLFIFAILRRRRRQAQKKRLVMIPSRPGPALQEVELEHFRDYTLISLESSERETPSQSGPESRLVDSVYPSVIVTTDEEA